MPLVGLNLLRRDQARYLEELCSFNGSLSEPNELKYKLEELHLRISELEEPRLIELATRASYIEWCAFILRGMCAAELRRRYRLRLKGGRGKRDQEGKGIQVHMTHLADIIGISPTTLMTDARIIDTFFSSVEDTTIAREHTLPREFYVIALSAPAPHEAIKTAARRVRDSGYSREQFRAYVRSLKQESRPRKQSQKVQATDLIHIQVPHAVQDALEEIIRLTGKSKAEELAEMIFARRKALSQRKENIVQRMGKSHNKNAAENEGSLQLTLAI